MSCESGPGFVATPEPVTRMNGGGVFVFESNSASTAFRLPLEAEFDRFNAGLSDEGRFDIETDAAGNTL